MKLTGTAWAKKSPRVTAMAFAAVVGLGLSVAAPAVVPGDCHAQSRRNLEASARYVSQNGQGFVLDVTGSRPLLRFDRSTEIWVLRPTPAPRGDIVYRNDNGDQVLRVTADGGMTLYTTAAPQGTPVSQTGEAAPLLAPALTAVQLWQYIVRQSERASRTLGRLVVVDVNIQPGSEAVAADALSTAVDAIARMSRSPNLRREADRIRRIEIVDQGRGPQATFARGVLRIVIVPRAGVAGRPSSARVVGVVGEDVLNR
ncbi:DUF4908 domain-containing protein [Pseudomonas sp. ODNR1LW]|nr:DUF4908 domain-containing protein [Pseudomonas sp. ODNR1LW]